MEVVEAVQGQPALPSWRSCLQQQQNGGDLAALVAHLGPVEGAVEALSGRTGEASEKQQREALLKVHQRLAELGEARGTPYGQAFEAYMLLAGARLEEERGGEGAAAALLAAVTFAITAQQEPGAPAALRSMLGPAASVAAAILTHAAQHKPARRLHLSRLMAALAELLLDMSKLDLAAFVADLATAEAAMRCAVAAGGLAAGRGSSSQRTALWGELLPAAFKAIRKLDDMDEAALLEGDRWRFVSACGALMGLALSATENLRLDVSLSDALAPLDRQEVVQGAVTLAHQLGCCYRDRLAAEPPPDEQTQAQLAQLLGWLSKALQLLSLLLQHGGQMEAFLDDGGVTSLCLHLAKYPDLHAQLPPTHAAHAVDCQVVELLTYALNNSKRARELLADGDQGDGGSGIKILLAALAAAPGLQTLLADAVVHSQLARWTFKRSLLKCLEAAVLTTSDHRKEILANDGVGVIVRSCRWRPHDAAFRPKQEAQLVRANPAFVRGIAGNAFSCLCIASQNLDEDKSYWNQVASKLAEATSADELMQYHKWMPAGQDAAQAVLNADKLSCSWGLHTALWRLLHPLTYNNKEQRAVFAANAEYIRIAAAALSLPNSDEALTKGRVCAFKPTVMYILYNAAIIDDACRKQQLQLGVHERALELLCQSFQMAGEQDRRILKAAATSKRSKGSSSTAATAATTGAKDAKTFQAGVGGQADAASLLLEGLLLKTDPETRSICRELVQQGRLASVQKALNNRIGSSYSESTLQTAERSFLKVLRHAEQAVAEQRQQQQQQAAAESERLATELLAAEEAATAKQAARAAKQQQRQRAAKQAAQQAPGAAIAASSSSSGDEKEARESQQAQAAHGRGGKGDGGGGGGGAPAGGTAATGATNGVAGGTGAANTPEQQREKEHAAREAKLSEQQQGYQRLLQEWEAAEAAAAVEAAAVVAAKKRSKKQQQREKAKEKKQAAAAAKTVPAGGAASSAAVTPVTSPKAMARAGSTGGAAKVIAVPLNGSRQLGAARVGSPVAGASRAASLAKPPGSAPAVASVPARPASAGAAAPPSRAAAARQLPSSAGPPISFAAAAAAGTGQTVGPPPAVLAAQAAAAQAATGSAVSQAQFSADAPPATPPRPPTMAAAAAHTSRASTPVVASPLLLSPQRPAALAAAEASQPLQQAQAAADAQHTPPRVLRAASAPALPAMGAATSAPASMPASVSASPQRSLFADMLPPMAPAASAPSASVAGASAPPSGAASGVASPTHQSLHMSSSGGLQGASLSGPSYGAYSGLGGLIQQQQNSAAARQAQQAAQQLPSAFLQRQQHGAVQGLGSLTPTALEAALMSKGRMPQQQHGGEEDGLGLLPFAVAEAALFDDSPAGAHALPLSVADFVLGDSDFGGHRPTGGHQRDSQGSDFSDILGHMLPGGSPLKPPAPKSGPATLNGAMHPRRSSSGGEHGLFGGAGAMHDRQQQHLSMAAAAAWGTAPASTHSSQDGAKGDQVAQAGSNSSSNSEVLMPGVGRYSLADGSTADSWFDRAKSRQLV